MRPYLPVNNDIAPSCHCIFNKLIGDWEELQKVFILNVLDVDLQVFEWPDEVFIDRPSYYGDHMGDVRRFDSFASTESKQTVGPVRQ